MSSRRGKDDENQVSDHMLFSFESSASMRNLGIISISALYEFVGSWRMLVVFKASIWNG